MSRGGPQRTARERVRPGGQPPHSCVNSAGVNSHTTCCITFPRPRSTPLDERFERFPWEQNTAWLEAWQRGRTGFPLVDAGMRELWATGWMHNRVRMLVASFLTKNLRQPWLSGARWFWDTLVDADLANNTLGWQWTAGCGADAAPFFRIFNPVLQAERHDPDRAYIRRWLPELARLPDSHIHRPWQAPLEMLANSGVALGSTYPYPIVDLRCQPRRGARCVRTNQDATRKVGLSPLPCCDKRRPESAVLLRRTPLDRRSCANPALRTIRARGTSFRRVTSLARFSLLPLG